MYAVHKSYIDKKLNNGTIIPCKIKTYMNTDGKIVPVLREIGGKTEPKAHTHYVYDTLEKAVKAITTKK